MTTVIPIHGNCNKEVGIQISESGLLDFQTHILANQCDNCDPGCLIKRISTLKNINELAELIESGMLPLESPSSPETTF